MKRLAVFCGSSSGACSSYTEGAILIGKELARREITLVYGGASVGIMGAVADTVLQEGGQVIGVMPQLLIDREISHQNVTEMFIVSSMHERKAKMAELADGFLALPGGPGTLEEFFEIFTWAQIGLHQKPFGLLNVNHYYDPLIALLQHMVKEQFLQEKYKAMAIVDSDVGTLLDKFYKYEPPTVKEYR
ncbi:LOG family protein [Brevibacillus daliensis]|uniref:LOG family protein n=1 Tax=Brevibacillus daliensis TaxID=2892995 RepID=UPI001E5C7EA9|nr:TIGR00730 family Rossman fold protein [Brevibacillus daliensis]